MKRYCLAGLSSIVVLLTISGTRAQIARCDAEDTPFWVRNIHERVTKFDRLGLFAIERYGLPIGCEGSVTTVFDGMEFGSIRLEFQNGATFGVETQPPEASFAALVDSSGFRDEAKARTVLHEYADGIGLSIDWSNPELTSEGRANTETYWDPDDGLNASASFTYVDSVLVELRLSMAL